MQKSTTVRYAAGYLALAAALPYFVLKIIWLTGGTVGFTGSTPQSAEFTALNAATFGMDAVAIVVALALTHRWGQRVPAPLVLFPMWVGTGFLATIAAGVPIAAALTALDGGDAFDGGAASIVQPWVYRVVYAGFIVQGIGLLTAFVRYARARWPRLPVPAYRDSVLRLIGTACAVLAAGLGVLYLFWALGGTAGLPSQEIRTSGFTGHVMDACFGVLSLLGAIGVVRLVRGQGSRWTAVALTWLGAGTNFSWGLWVTVNLVTDSPLTNGAHSLGVLGVTNLGRLLVGTLIGVVAAAELSRATHPITPATAPAMEIARSERVEA